MEKVFHFPSKLRPNLLLFPLKLQPNFFLFSPELRPRSRRFSIKGLLTFNRGVNQKKWDWGKVCFHAPYLPLKDKFGVKFPFNIYLTISCRSVILIMNTSPVTHYGKRLNKSWQNHHIFFCIHLKRIYVLWTIVM